MGNGKLVQDKLITMSEAIDRYVGDGDIVHLGGFIQQEPFAAVHEIIRQGKKDLTVSKCAALIPVDQMIGAGVIRHLITTFTWNPLPAPAHCFVRAMTRGVPRRIEIEEYSILTLNLAFFAGALDLPYVGRPRPCWAPGLTGKKPAQGPETDSDLRRPPLPVNGSVWSRP